MDNKNRMAAVLLSVARDTLDQRGKQYDPIDGHSERSMGRVVAAYTAITGRPMTEADAHLLMVLLKVVRAESDDQYEQDHYVDGINYMAMYGEAKRADAVAKTMAAITDKLESTGQTIRLTGDDLTREVATTWNGGHPGPRQPIAEGLPTIQLQTQPQMKAAEADRVRSFLAGKVEAIEARPTPPGAE